jgi:hypothetical protein
MATAKVLASALLFRATDDGGKMCPKDKEFVRKWYPRGVEKILTELCRLKTTSLKGASLSACATCTINLSGVSI